jgi:magnesium chelatase subunit H
VNITVFHVGTSLVSPLKQAEKDLNAQYGLKLRIATYNLGASLDKDTWEKIEADLEIADIVFVIHVVDAENGSRLAQAFGRHSSRGLTVIVFNCMPELMRLTRMGALSFSRNFGVNEGDAEEGQNGRRGSKRNNPTTLLRHAASWMASQVRTRSKSGRQSHTQYLRLIERLPGLLKLVPNTGKLRDVKNYLYLFSYFLQPTPLNVRSMVLYAIKNYVPDSSSSGDSFKIAPPEAVPAVAIYHPDANQLFESYDAYARWYGGRSRSGEGPDLAPERTIGLLLMRPQLISGARKHYDALIRAIEREGLAVIPSTSTLMDNREACERFFVAAPRELAHSKDRAKDHERHLVVSQIVSLTGFSFVGGPAMNDSQAASEFLTGINRPLRSIVSLDMQSIESWAASPIGLNPVQAGMQIAVPEIDGATEPFVFGGVSEAAFEPVALDERCQRIARRLKRWNRLQTDDPATLKIALLLFCFPPNKGNIGTAAELDVFPSIFEILLRLKKEGYSVELPEDADALRDSILNGNSWRFNSPANVAYAMDVNEYLQLCPYADDIEGEWGEAPGTLNAFGGKLLIQGIELGNVFLGIQPTFGYEGDPMRLLMARNGAPHHGFMAFYTYVSRIFQADVVVHVGTHGALEFMPGKQVGLSTDCWPDRLIGDLPHVYIYSVNNPSEGTIAKRRSYAELISYLSPPIESAGLYKDLSELKELLMAYRHSADENDKSRLFDSIEDLAERLHL